MFLLLLLLSSPKLIHFTVFPQDWLNTEFDEMDITVRSLTLGNEWLHEMANAAQKLGITLQYCMATARHTLTSLELPVVTQVPDCFCCMC